jgi:hypothetical protein
VGSEPWPRGRARHGGVDRVPLPEDDLGGLWLAGKRYVAPDPVGALAAVGAETVVCLCERHELEGHWPGYVRWLETGPALWVPVPDLHAPPAEVARSLAGAVARRLDRGEGVIVHCGAGRGRAGTLAVAVLLAYGVGLEEALDTVAAARPGAGPEVGSQTLLLRRLAARPSP